jgi:hypothetical protein
MRGRFDAMITMPRIFGGHPDSRSFIQAALERMFRRARRPRVTERPPHRRKILFEAWVALADMADFRPSS